MSSPSGPAANPKEAIRQEWVDAAPYWKKWYDKFSFQSQAATELLMTGAMLARGQRVLDLASGSGQPALSIARMVAPDGHVVATDLVPEMLSAAEETAREARLGNIEFRTADAEYLPFANKAFDRLTCRFGMMFFPDVHRALTEQRRVLKAGGRLSVVTWGPLEENPMFALMVRAFRKRVEVPEPGPNAPHIFRFADVSLLDETLTGAGFRDVAVAKHRVPWPWPGKPEEFWNVMSGFAAPFKRMMAKLPEEQKDEVTAEIVEGTRQYFDGQQINFSASILSAAATP